MHVSVVLKVNYALLRPLHIAPKGNYSLKPTLISLKWAYIGMVIYTRVVIYTCVEMYLLINYITIYLLLEIIQSKTNVVNKSIQTLFKNYKINIIIILI